MDIAKCIPKGQGDVPREPCGEDVGHSADT